MPDAPAPAPAPTPAPASAPAPGSDPTARLQAELTEMSGSAEGLLGLAAIGLLAVYVVFNVVFSYGAAAWESVVAAALILLARFMPSGPAGGLSNKTALFVLGFVIFAFAAMSLIYDVRNLQSLVHYDAIDLAGEVFHILVGALAGLALFRMMG